MPTASGTEALRRTKELNALSRCSGVLFVCLGSAQNMTTLYWISKCERTGKVGCGRGMSWKIATSFPGLLLFTAQKRSCIVWDPSSIAFMHDDVIYWNSPPSLVNREVFINLCHFLVVSVWVFSWFQFLGYFLVKIHHFLPWKRGLGWKKVFQSKNV